MNAREAQAFFLRVARRLPGNVQRAERESAEDLCRIGRNWSMGPYTTQMLRRMRHPYARRHPRPPQDPGIINLQSGLFIRSWRVDGPHVFSGNVATTVRNNAPYAGYLHTGTHLMIRRPITTRILAEGAPARRQRLTRAAREAFNE